MKALELISIGNSSYCIRLEHQGKDLEYEFEIEGDSILGNELWEKSYGAETQKFLLDCIRSFHKAKDSFMQEVEPLRSVLNPEARYEVHNKKMVPLRLLLLGKTPEGITKYRVYFDQAGEIVDYEFEVDKHGYGWDRQFWLDIDGELDVARPLFDSLGSFDDMTNALAQSSEKPV